MAHIPLDFSTDSAFAWSDQSPSATGTYRCCAEDFRVDEVLGFEPDGEGEHIYINIEKVGQNTHWVVEQMARQLGIPEELFGRAGLKDRHAVTTQWLSVQSPKTAPNFERIQMEGVRVISTARHAKKLRPGMHAQNQFQLRLRALKGEADQIESVLVNIRERGFPNYFGEQRFGFDGQNLHRGWELLQRRRLGRHKKKSIYLSALRSFLFNQVLSQRINDQLLTATEEFDDTGPLWGRGRLSISAPQIDYEQRALNPWLPLSEALEFSGLSQERRTLMIIPKSMRWKWLEEDHLSLEFSLPPGSYATSLIRELGDMVDMSKEERKLNE